jgi:hypothetical protein
MKRLGSSQGHFPISTGPIPALLDCGVSHQCLCHDFASRLAHKSVADNANELGAKGVMSLSGRCTLDSVIAEALHFVQNIHLAGEERVRLKGQQNLVVQGESLLNWSGRWSLCHESELN